MKIFQRILFVLVVSLFFGACVQPPDFPNVPVIEYIGVNRDTVYQGVPGLPADTLSIEFSYTDGDGDLSSEDSTDIFLYDSRFPGEPFQQNRIPTFPTDGTGNGIKGEITVNILSANSGLCCIQDNLACPINPTNPLDTFSLFIEISDRAGNLSNRIQTEMITIRCSQ